MSAARLTAAAALLRANAELRRKLDQALVERDEALEYDRFTHPPLDGGGPGWG